MYVRRLTLYVRVKSQPNSPDSGISVLSNKHSPSYTEENLYAINRVQNLSVGVGCGGLGIKTVYVCRIITGCQGSDL